MENDFKYIKIAICIILINYLIVNTIALVYNYELLRELEPKFIVRGEILEMNYFNFTFSNEVNFNIISRQQKNITEYYYNLTIFNQLTKSIEYYSLEISVIKSYDIQIGNIIELWDLKGGFYDIKIIKGSD